MQCYYTKIISHPLRHLHLKDNLEHAESPLLYMAYIIPYHYSKLYFTKNYSMLLKVTQYFSTMALFHFIMRKKKYNLLTIGLWKQTVRYLRPGLDCSHEVPSSTHASSSLLLRGCLSIQAYLIVRLVGPCVRGRPVPKTKEASSTYGAFHSEHIPKSLLLGLLGKNSSWENPVSPWEARSFSLMSRAKLGQASHLIFFHVMSSDLFALYHKHLSDILSSNPLSPL